MDKAMGTIKLKMSDSFCMFCYVPFHTKRFGGKKVWTASVKDGSALYS